MTLKLRYLATMIIEGKVGHEILNRLPSNSLPTARSRRRSSRLCSRPTCLPILSRSVVTSPSRCLLHTNFNFFSIRPGDLPIYLERDQKPMEMSRSSQQLLPICHSLPEASIDRSSRVYTTPHHTTKKPNQIQNHISESLLRATKKSKTTNQIL